MKSFNLKDFKRGWIIGNFSPSIIKTSNYEIAIMEYKSGDYEKHHFHKQAVEITVIVHGEVLMNGIKYKENDIILIEKGEKTNFKALINTITVVIKMPSITGDKYVI